MGELIAEPHWLRQSPERPGPVIKDWGTPAAAFTGGGSCLEPTAGQPPPPTLRGRGALSLHNRVREKPHN